MLDNPFSGKELFAYYETGMRGLTAADFEEAWDQIGKTKKAAWNNLAKVINERMRSESNFIKGEQSGS